MRNVTIWSVLTLITVLAGGGGTLLFDRMELRRWGESGIAIPLGQAYDVDLPAGSTVVYYESSAQVPTHDVLLAMRDGDGRLVPLRPPAEDNSYRLNGDGWSGRALWEYADLPEGTYTVVVTNSHYERNEDIPEDDRVVFVKEPNTLADVHARRRRIHLFGVGITLVLAAGFYGAHLRAGRAGRAERAGRAR